MTLATKLNVAQRGLLHALCTSKDESGTWDSRHRAALQAMERRGLVTLSQSYDPSCRSKSVPLYTATVTATGRALFASLEK